MKPKHRATLPFAALSGLTLALTAPSLSAADFVWDGTTNTWNSAHWDAGAGLVAGPTGASSANTATINGGLVNFAGHDTFGNDGTTASAIINLNGGTLASNGSFTTIWNLNLNGGTLLANGGANGSYPAFQLAGTVTVGGSQMSTIDATTAVNANNQINIGGNGNLTLTFDVADVTGNANPDLTINATLQNSNYGAGSLTKTGVGTMTLSGTNTYTGSTLVNAGTLEVNGGTIAGPGFIDIGSVGNAANFTLTSGNVTAGSQFVIGAHGSTGTAAINGGALQVNGRIYIGGYGEGTGTGTITQTAGTVTSTGGVDFGGGGPNHGIYNLSGGTLTTTTIFKYGSGTATFNFNGGTLRPSAASATFMEGLTAANVQSGGALINTNGFIITIAQALLDGGGGGGLAKSGANTLTLTGASTYTGPTTVTGGTLKAGVASVANVSGAFGNNSAVTLTNATGVILDITGFNTQIGSLTGGGATGGNVTLGAATLTVGGANTSPAAYAGVISGTGGLTKMGSGTLILSGPNTYTGATMVDAGALAFAGGGTLAAGAAISVASGATLAFARHDTFGNHATAVSQTITVNGGTITNANNAFTTLGAVTLNGGTINSTGGAAASFPSFSLRGPITVGGSAASTISGSGANSQMVVGVNTAGSQTTFDVANATGDSAADLTASVPLQNNRDGAHAEIATGIIKTGAGTMVLSGANTYTGATSVNGGKLIVGVAGVGSTASGSAVTVAAGTVTDTPVATLGGTGTIGGNVSLAVQSAATFKNGGVLAPTAAASGTQLKVTGTTTFNAGSIFEWSMSAVTPATDPGAAPNPGSYSQLAGTDAITGTDAVFKVVLGAGNAFSDAFWDTAKTWNNVFSGAGATNTLASMFSSIGGSGITYDGGTSRGNVADEGYFTVSGTNTLNWTAVPEPTSALAGLLLTAGLLRRRRSNVG